jgi:hypothetical protein
MFLGAMSGSITRQVVLELDIEQPMHALDAPVAARAPGNTLDVERGTDMVVGIEGAPIRSSPLASPSAAALPMTRRHPTTDRQSG